MRLTHVRPHWLAAIAILGLVTTGCATKRYVRTTVAPLDAKIAQLDKKTQDKTTGLASDIEGVENDLSRTKERLSDTVVPTLQRVRAHTQLPIAVGFGISRPEQVQAVWSVADGAVVGSAIVSEIEKTSDPLALPSRIGEFCRRLTGKT